MTLINLIIGIILLPEFKIYINNSLTLKKMQLSHKQYLTLMIIYDGYQVQKPLMMSNITMAKVYDDNVR